jgi:ABC-2 type transport system permease protein
MTYVSEMLRGAIVPHVDHMPVWVTMPVTVASVLLFSLIGMYGFNKRALD